MSHYIFDLTGDLLNRTGDDPLWNPRQNLGDGYSSLIESTAQSVHDFCGAEQNRAFAEAICGIALGQYDALKTAVADRVAELNTPACTMWCAYMAFLEAQNDFSRWHCAIPSGEDVLTGAFRALLASSAKFWSYSLSMRGISCPSLRAFTIDLTVEGGEQISGGDLAIIFEVPDGDDNARLIPLLFQAKRSKAARLTTKVLIERKKYTSRNANDRNDDKTQQQDPSEADDGRWQLNLLKGLAKAGKWEGVTG